MDKKQNKTYYIEFYNQQDNSLLNKFKFSLDAVKIADLKAQIRDRLLAKKEIQADTELSIKDADDFELGSDDEVKDVVPDGKLKLFKKNKSHVAVNVPQVVVPAQTVPVLPVKSSVPVLPAADYVTKCQILDLKFFAIPMIGQEVKHKMTLFCPQIRKSPIEIAFDISCLSHYDLSNYIVKSLGLSPSLRAILYNKNGQPYIYNLDLLHQLLPKIDFSDEQSVIFTPTACSVDEAIVIPNILNDNTSEIQVTKGTDKFTIEIDLDNTLEVLKYKIFEITRIHPSNQIIKFANNPLSNKVEILKVLGIKPNNILQLSFRLNSNLVPCTYADKFFYKDITHTHVQSEDSITNLRANLLVLAAHLSAEDKVRLPVFIRGYTQNLPLTFGLKLLLDNKFVSQTHRIALEEGFLVSLADYIKRCTPVLDTLEFKQIFTHFRHFIGFAIEGISKVANLASSQEIKKNEQFVEVQRYCHFTMKPIKNPKLIKLDDNNSVIVDKELMEEQILKGFTYPLLKAPKKYNLYESKDLFETYESYLNNLVDNSDTNTLLWLGFNSKHPQVELPAFGEVNKYVSKIDGYPELKVHQPLQIKNKCSSYLLMITKENKLKVFLSKNKDVSRPFNIYNVFTGEETSVNLDLMSANVKSQNLQEVIDNAQIIPVITRDPKEAIVILFDISGSMAGGFFNEKDLSRIGAVKSFFEAFAFRTIAYNLEHVVSLIFFDHVAESQCGFTQAIYDFNRLIAKATPRGSTLMYDAIITAVTQLNIFKQKYPECVLRIVALTDGEDTGSSSSIELTTRAIIQNQIIIDSFAVGANCDGLKTISQASGGKCYLTRNLEESLKLFEQQTVLSVRARKVEVDLGKFTLEQKISIAKSLPFDLPNSVHAFKLPEIKPGFSGKEMMKLLEGAEQLNKLSGNASLKRIAKEIKNFTENPHPFVSIYPCSNINLWKILLVGPKETPYENGLFLLYIQFPGDYPFRAPLVRFITPIYHCNMNSQGRICHSILDRNYSPAISFRQIMDCIYGLILTPEPDDPLDNVVASFYLSDYPIYLKKAKESTKANASDSTEKIVDELFGRIVDDSERKEKEKEIEEWILLAKSFN